MKIVKSNHKGFTVVEVLLILVIVGVLGFVGWFVYSSKKKSEKSQSNAANVQSDPVKAKKITVEPKDESDNWLLYSPPGREYQFRVPDGWKLERYSTSSNLYTDGTSNIIYKKGTLATVKQVENGRDFSGMAFGLSYVTTSELMAPNGTEQVTSLKTKQGIAVTKYKETVSQDPEFLGPPKGTIEFNYRISKGNYSISIIHDVLLGETDQTQYIEKAIKTIEFL